MRIAVFSDCYLPAVNGVVTSITQQLEILEGRGHQVDLYCPLYPDAVADGASVFRLWARPFPFHKREQFALPWPPPVLSRLWSERYDLFHLQTPFSVGLVGLGVALLRTIPRVFHHHTLWEEYVDYLPLPRGITSGGSIALCRGVANLCQAVVAPSVEVRERFAAQGAAAPISVIPTGIRTALFQNGSPRPERSEGEEVCLYVGRLAHEKSLDVLLRVFALIHRERPSVRLWLVGDGPARGALEKQSAELGVQHVCRFFGFVPRHTLRDFMATARLFLFASLTETQGLVLLEAQAGGLPVVAFSASGVNEAVDSGRTGFLVESGREELMAESALRLLSQTELWASFSENARRWAEKFSLEKMGEALEETYMMALKEPKNGDK